MAHAGQAVNDARPVRTRDFGLLQAHDRKPCEQAQAHASAEAARETGEERRAAFANAIGSAAQHVKAEASRLSDKAVENAEEGANQEAGTVQSSHASKSLHHCMTTRKFSKLAMSLRKRIDLQQSCRTMKPSSNLIGKLEHCNKLSNFTRSAGFVHFETECRHSGSRPPAGRQDSRSESQQVCA